VFIITSTPFRLEKLFVVFKVGLMLLYHGDCLTDNVRAVYRLRIISTPFMMGDTSGTRIELGTKKADFYKRQNRRPNIGRRINGSDD
jgi:hypothetical protein